MTQNRRKMAFHYENMTEPLKRGRNATKKGVILVAYRTDKQRAAIAAQNEDRALLIRIRALIGVVGSMETVATLAGLSPQTFRRRMKSPGDFTRSEIRALARIERREYGKEGEPWLISA